MAGEGGICGRGGGMCGRRGDMCGKGHAWGGNVTGPLGALSFDVKPEIARRITRTAVLFQLPPGHLLHSFSCNSKIIPKNSKMIVVQYHSKTKSYLQKKILSFCIHILIGSFCRCMKISDKHS